MSVKTPSYELFGVSANTPEFAFSDPKACSDFLERAYTEFEQDEAGTQSQYVIISNVDEKCLNEGFGESGYDLNRLAGCDYLVKEKLLLTKLTTGPQEVAHSTFNGLFVEKIGFVNKSLLPTGKAAVSTETRKRSPDQSCVPMGRRRGKRYIKWPSFVTEAGYSQSKDKVDYDIAQWWLKESIGDVKVVVTISFQPKRRAMTFEKWNLIHCPTETDPQRKIPQITYRTVLSQSAAQEKIQASHSEPLILPSSDIFLQEDPTDNEPDVLITVDELKEIAESLWVEQFNEPMYLEDVGTK